MWFSQCLCGSLCLCGEHVTANLTTESRENHRATENRAKFINRFGGPGHQPGQLSAVNAIAVDGKGRVYVSDTKGVQVFDADGRHLTVFDPGGVASGIVFNDRNELLIVSRSKVIKFALKE